MLGSNCRVTRLVCKRLLAKVCQFWFQSKFSVANAEKVCAWQRSNSEISPFRTSHLLDFDLNWNSPFYELPFTSFPHKNSLFTLAGPNLILESLETYLTSSLAISLSSTSCEPQQTFTRANPGARQNDRSVVIRTSDSERVIKTCAHNVWSELVISYDHNWSSRLAGSLRSPFLETTAWSLSASNYSPSDLRRPI